MTTKEDILSIAESLEITLLDEEVQEILDVQKKYPSDLIWDLKEQIYNVIEPRSHAMQIYECPKCPWFGTMTSMLDKKICPQCGTNIF